MKNERKEEFKVIFDCGSKQEISMTPNELFNFFATCCNYEIDVKRDMHDYDVDFFNFIRKRRGEKLVYESKCD
jgi:hypothetical protein